MNYFHAVCDVFYVATFRGKIIIRSLVVPWSIWRSLLIVSDSRKPFYQNSSGNIPVPILEPVELVLVSLFCSGSVLETTKVNGNGCIAMDFVERLS